MESRGLDALFMAGDGRLCVCFTRKMSKRRGLGGRYVADFALFRGGFEVADGGRRGKFARGKKSLGGCSVILIEGFVYEIYYNLIVNNRSIT